MKILAASTSTIYGDSYLNYLKKEIIKLFRGLENILFIPYACPGGISWNEYTAQAKSFFGPLGIKIYSIHEGNPEGNLSEAKGVFVGGGNTFVLLNTLQNLNLTALLKERIECGMPYLGTSAGSNILGDTIKTTNDMPIVEVSDLCGLKVFPFNINPHYFDPVDGHKHMGESRETRLKEYINLNKIPVIGLREGSYLFQDKDKVILKGPLTARVFSAKGEIYELPSGSKVEI